jgi:hypothetical protein
MKWCTGLSTKVRSGSDPADEQHVSDSDATEIVRSPSHDQSRSANSDKESAQPAVIMSRTGPPAKGRSGNEDNSSDSDAIERIKPTPRDQSPSKKRCRDDTSDDGVYSSDDDHLDDQDYTNKAPPSKKAATSKTKAAGEAKPAPKKRAAAKKIARPPPAPSSRPSRTRKAPERLAEASEVKPVKPAKKQLAKKGTGKVFDPVYITTNSTSRLVKADVFHMLLEPAAWTSLSTEQKITLMSMLPQDATHTELLDFIRATDGLDHLTDTRPYAFTINNDCFRTDVAKFQADLRNGHLGKTWQASAEQAVVDRAAGVYDGFKAEEFEQWWGQKSQPKN